MKTKKNLLLITPLDDLPEVYNILKKKFIITYKKDINNKEIFNIIENYDCVFTNPNNTKIYFGKKLLDKAKSLKIICTASTGTTHIDLNQAKLKKIKIISIKEERRTINQITSTAEHALALTLNSLRNLNTSNKSVLENKWDYQKYIGRQLNNLNFGIVGYGRLGKYYAKYIYTIGGKVHIYDPFKTQINLNYKKHSKLKSFLKEIDVMSIHIHYNKNNDKIINKSWFSAMKKNALIVNTSRGEVVDEKDLIENLLKNKNFKYAADVISDEINFKQNKLLAFSKKYLRQVFITPHIGGMTTEGRKIAYQKAADRLIEYYN